MQIYEKKEQNMALINFKKIEDEDLFIDFKLDINSKRPNVNDNNLFELLNQSRVMNDRGSRADERKGREHEDMPYFLTDQYRSILDAS